MAQPITEVAVTQRVVLCTTFLCAAAAPAVAQLPESQQHAVDSVFAQWNADEVPGCVAGVMQDGRLVFARGYGMANLSTGSRLEPSTRIGVASLSKQFTAAAIALLVSEGRLDADADVRTWLPELPDYGAPIRVRDLVYQTTGLRDYLSLLSLRGDDAEAGFDDGELLRLIMQQLSTNHEPGTEYAYSNTNYHLLGEIIRRVTGQPLHEYTAQHLFGPLGMRATAYAQPGDPLEETAASYRIESGSLREVTLTGRLGGAGGVYMTLEDLARWDAHFLKPTLTADPAAFIQRITERGTLRSGATSFYGWGTQFAAYRGLDTQGHGGTWGGYRVQYLRFPTERVGIAVLCNQLEISPFQLVRRVADVVLRDRLHAQPDPAAGPPLTPSPAAPAPQQVDSRTAARYVGEYWSHDLDTSYRIVHENALLRVRSGLHTPWAASVASQDTLLAGGARLIFERNTAGLPTGFTLHTGRVRNVRFERVGGPSPAISIPRGRSVTVNGSVDGDEWSDAREVLIRVAPDWIVRARMKHDGEHLAFGFFDLRDGMVRVPEVLVDAGNDGGNVWDADDWWFHASAQDCASTGGYNDYTTCVRDAAEWSATNVSGMSYPQVMELRIPMRLIGTAAARTIRIAVNVTDTREIWNFWPVSAQMANPGSWARAVIDP
jgi:CubicO group peptidase (beta-lactamase class C family)